MVHTARYDKYDSENGGFRARLAANLTLSSSSYGPVGVGLDANGRVVAGIGNSGIKGVLVKSMILPGVAGSATITQVTAPGAMAGDTVDVMTDGEIVDVALVAGTTYWADGATGAIVAGQASGGAAPASGAGSTAGSVKIGFTIEATRLIVRVARS